MGPKPKTPEAGAKFNRLTFVAVDREEQNFSRNYTWKVLVDGVLMSVPKAAASRGLKYHTVRARLQRGLSIEAALVPVQQ